MDFSLPPGLLDHSPEGLLAVVVILVLTGQLVPGREMRYWRRAFFEEQKLRMDGTRTAETTRDLLKAIPRALDQEQP